MSKFLCQCGEVIRDQSDSLPYKGYVLADIDYDTYFNAVSRDIAEYLEARLAGAATEWLAKYFSTGYPSLKLPDADVIDDIMKFQFRKISFDIFQCSACGRIHVEHRDDPTQLAWFAAEETPWRDIFAKPTTS